MEQAAPGEWQPATAPTPSPQTAAPTPAHAPVTRETAPEVIAVINALNARLGAVEGAVHNLPRTAGIVKSLLLALGTRALMALSLLGCLALAGYTIWSPSWQGISITAMMCLLFAYLAWIDARRGL